MEVQELRGKADTWTMEKQRLEATNTELQRSAVLWAQQKEELARHREQGRRALATRWAGGEGGGRALATRWAGPGRGPSGPALATSRLSHPLSGPQRPRCWGPLLQQPCLMEWGAPDETAGVKGSPRLGRHPNTQTPTQFPAP